MNARKCKTCSHEFVPTAPRQEYCRDCGPPRPHPLVETRPCRRPGCPNTVTTADQRLAYCGDECRRIVGRAAADKYRLSHQRTSPPPVDSPGPDGPAWGPAELVYFVTVLADLRRAGGSHSLARELTQDKLDALARGVRAVVDELTRLKKSGTPVAAGGEV